jgi:6-phosphofructokinase 1
LKYIDPTYIVRAVAANAADNLYCTLLAHSAIHGAVAGYTGFVPGPINGQWQQWLHPRGGGRRGAQSRRHQGLQVGLGQVRQSVTNQPDFIQSTEVQALTGLYKAM